MRRIVANDISSVRNAPSCPIMLERLGCLVVFAESSDQLLLGLPARDLELTPRLLAGSNLVLQLLEAPLVVVVLDAALCLLSAVLALGSEFGDRRDVLGAGLPAGDVAGDAQILDELLDVLVRPVLVVVLVGLEIFEQFLADLGQDARAVAVGLLL